MVFELLIFELFILNYMPNFAQRTSFGIFSINIDASASKILNFNPIFFTNILKRFGEIVTKKRKELILDQFIEYPGRSTTKVTSRSGTLKKSIKVSFKVIDNQVILYATYDPRYQTVQPSDNRASITIGANEKNFLAIPNQRNNDLFDSRGVYNFKDIDLTNPRHPFGIESKRLKRKGNVLLRVRGNQRGMVYYFLKKSITIKTKRPIYVADQRLFKMNQRLLNQAFEEVFRKTFL